LRIQITLVQLAAFFPVACVLWVALDAAVFVGFDHEAKVVWHLLRELLEHCSWQRLVVAAIDLRDAQKRLLDVRRQAQCSELSFSVWTLVHHTVPARIRPGHRAHVQRVGQRFGERMLRCCGRHRLDAALGQLEERRLFGNVRHVAHSRTQVTLSSREPSTPQPPANPSTHSHAHALRRPRCVTSVHAGDLAFLDRAQDYLAAVPHPPGRCPSIIVRADRAVKMRSRCNDRGKKGRKEKVAAAKPGRYIG
jgi:hypothetical protein